MRNRFAILVISPLILAGTLALPATLEAQAAPGLKPGEYKTVWSSVFTETQAARGLAEFDANCLRCHTVDVDVLNPDARMIGPAFLERWREYDAESLFSFIKASMPRRDPGSLTDQAYLDIVAHLFKSNLFPAGEEELTLDVVESIQIERKDGPRPVPSGALIQVVGCLAPDGAGWKLASAGEPVRTDTSNTSTPKELDHALVRELGNQTFRLQNVDYLGSDFDLDSYSGQKMQTKGYVIRQPNRERIDITSMEMVSVRCER
jgi:mono/diheme cytochrome c family protein